MSRIVLIPWMMKKILLFRAIANLRKICNHPDLYEDSTQKVSINDVERSGKLSLVNKLLPLWKENDHRVLLYSQSVKMLNIFEDLLKSKKYKYLRMDGSTNISERQDLIDKFNKDESIFIFILTTKG
jgi:DNA excision repair protein ERCC-6